MSHATRPYRGVFPVAPTVFGEDGELDLEGQKRAIDFMIDAGSNGICILANWSEQFVLTDAERERLTDVVVGHVAGYPDGIRQIVDAHFAGDREAAAAAYQRWPPLINFENRQCGPAAAKVLMKEGGIVRSEMTRHPLLPLHPATRAGLVEIARRVEPLVLRWGR